MTKSPKQKVNDAPLSAAIIDRRRRKTTHFRACQTLLVVVGVEGAWAWLEGAGVGLRGLGGRMVLG